MLQTGTKAPEFTLPDQNGELHSLKDYRGKRVLLYFYPRDNTPGCTKQACGYFSLTAKRTHRKKYTGVYKAGLRIQRTLSAV